MKMQKRFLVLLLIIALVLPMIPLSNNHVHAWDFECAHCGEGRSSDWLCDTCGGCGIESQTDCFFEYHCPCGACYQDIPICDDCRQCLDCVSGDVMCVDCGRCEDCAGTICGECQRCLDCIGFDEYCTGCDKCAMCMGMGFCYECELCGDCTTMCSNDDCPFCEGCTGQVCDDCGQCALCAFDIFCENCGLCGECCGQPLCQGCNYCSDCATVCKGCENCCSECGEVCLTCEECEDCIGSTICPGCHECINCSGATQCESCNYCSNCVNICEECGEVCDDCAAFCLECDKCENCVELCHDCGDYCFECKDYCHLCESCEECANLCEDCGEVCDNCAAFCLECNKCENCVNLCENCGEVCDDCAAFCLECNKCENCVNLCAECGEICDECADSCDHCNKCENCVNLCSTCGKNCDNCLSFCQGCNTCSDCSYSCPGCGMFCTECEEDWTCISADEFQHKDYCSCGALLDLSSKSHIFVYNVVKPETMINDGFGEMTCLYCDYKKIIPIPATGGEDHIHDYSLWQCNASFHRKYCVCGKREPGVPPEEEKHTFEWIIENEATIEHSGLKHQECTVCGFQLPGVPILPIDHTHVYEPTWSFNHQGHWHECSCGHRSDEYIHSWDEWIVIHPATEIENGIKERECSVCDYKQIGVIPKVVPADTTKPVITLLGSATVNVATGSTYTDVGATANDDIDGDITGNIVVGGDTIDTSIAGTYEITYNVSDAAGNTATQVTRTVIVAEEVVTPDTTKPVITLLGSATVNVANGATYTDAGATANDNKDGDITGDIIVGGDTIDTSTAGTYEITYNVSDAAGNPATQVTRRVIVAEKVVIPDTTKPVITLLGSATVNVANGATYTDAGATANDNKDGDITGDIIVGGDTIDTSTAGTYEITYNVSDAAGNPATQVTRRVIVAASGGGSSSGGSSSITTTYTIKTSASEGGKIEADKTVSVKAGKNVEFNIKPNEGYEIEDVKVDGKSVGVVSSYEFTKVKADHTISATFKNIEEAKQEIEEDKDFNDVPKNEWYYDSVMKAFNKGWFTGTSDTMFSPNSAMSRGMIVTVLWRIEGQPAAMLNSFNDVATDMYYNSAVAWAAEKGIVNGYGNNVFGPNDSITREQMASILYRYAQYKGYDTTQGGMAIREFSDYENISEYALPTLAWGVNTGLIQGANNKLMPKDSATRAQVAAMLMRFGETIVR